LTELMPRWRSVPDPRVPEDEFSLLAEPPRGPELVHQQDDPREMQYSYLRLFFGVALRHAVPGELPAWIISGSPI